MTKLKTKIDRRSFIKTSVVAGGGLMISFSWLASCSENTSEQVLQIPEEWFELNSYLKIGENGVVTVRVPNPEFGQNLKTSMPMIVADELDTDWKYIVAEQAPFDTSKYVRQLSGGSQSIRQTWNSLRMAGATAKHMLKQAAANEWQVPINDIVTEGGRLIHKTTERSANYGEFASAAALLEVPEEVELKKPSAYNIIGSSRKNVDGKKIVTGQSMFGVDIKTKGMLYAMIVHPPAFGLKLKSFEASSVKSMPGIQNVFSFKTFQDDYERNYFDTNTHNELVAIVGNSTWEVMNAKRSLKVEWEEFDNHSHSMNMFGNKVEVRIPKGLESTKDHLSEIEKFASRPGKVLRKDGDPEKAFNDAETVIERTYSAPFLAHNTMEPMNCYADVRSDYALIRGPIQAPEFIEKSIAARLELPLEKVDIQMERMGGGFGRRAYGHYMVEAAIISQKMKNPIKLMYTREDDMTYGIYRPTYTVSYRAALDKSNNLIAWHVKGGGIPESSLGSGAANRFPAGAIDNYMAEEWSIESNITIGAFRAPRSNFLAGAEQSFVDEIAEAAGKDPIEFRLELLERAKNNPVGEKNDYEVDRLAGVLKLVKEKSKWGETKPGISRGVSAYFCHNSYAAHVVDVKLKNGRPVVEKVTCAMDCGIVVNPDAAANMAEGAIVDGIGNALFGSMTFRTGVPEKNNFHQYRMIRYSEAPKEIEVHFVKNEIDPTGMGEPPFPPIFSALANAIYGETKKRHYNQPFLDEN
ncbi:MAG: molybdopterin-dependent oxidoreductase [Reichenbachiella sp.]